MVKTVDERKDAAWKKVLGARDEVAIGRCGEVYKEEKRNVKRCIYQSKKDVNEQFGRKMNQEVDGNRKLFWKEVSKVNGGKVESCSRIKNGDGRLAQGEGEVRRNWREYFEDLYNIYIREQVAATCVALMGFGEVITWEESQLEELWLRCEWGNLRMERPQVGMRSLEK